MVVSPPFGYIIYHSETIPDYTFIPLNIDSNSNSNNWDKSLYEKKLVCKVDVKVLYQNVPYILKAGIHYFPKFSQKESFTLHLPDVDSENRANTMERNRILENIQLFQILKPPELVVSKIFRDKQVIIDKYLKDIHHSESIGKLFEFYPAFIPNLTHTYKYIFSIYQENIMYTKYLQLNNDIGASLYHQYCKDGYIEKRIPLIEYKGKIKNIVTDETIVENVLTSLNNQKIVEDSYISTYILGYSFEASFLKIKYVNKDHNVLKKRLKDEYMLILRPPKFDEFIDLYEPYSEEIREASWKSHFDKIDELQDQKQITFVKI